MDCTRASEELEEHLATLEADAGARIEQSREALRAVIDELRAAELNARIEQLPDQARETEAFERLIDAKRLKDYAAAKEILSEIDEVTGKE
ncbi:MAG: hypothetical protein ACP5KN_19000 [Armatimonadota bacterium]